MRIYLPNILLWLGLIALTVLAYTYAEGQATGAVYVVIGIACVKFLAIGLQFMEGRHAHIVWPVWLVSLFLVYAAGIFFFAAY